MTLIIITAIQASPLVLGEIIYDDHAVSFCFLLFFCHLLAFYLFIYAAYGVRTGMTSLLDGSIYLCSMEW